MALNVLALRELLEIRREEDVKSLLLSFETLKVLNSAKEHDVQSFLHLQSIEYEKFGLSRTYLVMSTFKNKPFIAGYFSISNKPLIIKKKSFQKLSNSLKKKLMGVGHKTEQNSYEIKSYLLGQLGRNYSEVAMKANLANGDDLLTLSYSKIKEAHNLVGGRILYLECDNYPKLIEFYTRNGFRQIENYDSVNDQSIMVKKLDDLY